MALSQSNQQKPSDLRISESKEKSESTAFVQMGANSHVEKYLLETNSPRRKTVIMAKFGGFDDEGRVLSTNRDLTRNATRMNSSSLDLIDFDEDEDENITDEPVTKLGEILRQLEDLGTDVYLPFELKGKKGKKSLQIPDEYAQSILLFSDKEQEHFIQNKQNGKMILEKLLRYPAIVIGFTSNKEPIVYCGDTGPAIVPKETLFSPSTMKVGSLVNLSTDDGKVCVSELSKDSKHRFPLNKTAEAELQEENLRLKLQPVAQEISSLINLDKQEDGWNYRLDKLSYEALPRLHRGDVSQGLEVRSKQGTPGKVISKKILKDKSTKKDIEYAVVEYYREQINREGNKVKRSTRALTRMENIKKKVY